jgi:hypothetical protein
MSFFLSILLNWQIKVEFRNLLINHRFKILFLRWFSFYHNLNRFRFFKSFRFSLCDIDWDRILMLFLTNFDFIMKFMYLWNILKRLFIFISFILFNYRARMDFRFFYFMLLKKKLIIFLLRFSWLILLNLIMMIFDRNFELLLWIMLKQLVKRQWFWKFLNILLNLLLLLYLLRYTWWLYISTFFTTIDHNHIKLSIKRNFIN